MWCANTGIHIISTSWLSLSLSLSLPYGLLLFRKTLPAMLHLSNGDFEKKLAWSTLPQSVISTSVLSGIFPPFPGYSRIPWILYPKETMDHDGSKPFNQKIWKGMMDMSWILAERKSFPFHWKYLYFCSSDAVHSRLRIVGEASGDSWLSFRWRSR